MEYITFFKTFGISGGIVVVVVFLLSWVIRFVLKANEAREEKLMLIIQNHIHDATESNKELTTVIKELKILIEKMNGKV